MVEGIAPAVKLGEDAGRKLCAAALVYLEAEHHHADDQLGTGRFEPRAWAGYLAVGHIIVRAGCWSCLLVRGADAILTSGGQVPRYGTVPGH